MTILSIPATAIHSVESLLSEPEPVGDSVQLRSHRRHDMAWIIDMHEQICRRPEARELAEISHGNQLAEDFLRNYDPCSDCCWIATSGEHTVGTAMLVRESPVTARLAALIVDPLENNRGIGRRLMLHCIAFAKNHGYQAMSLWAGHRAGSASHLFGQLGGISIRPEAPGQAQPLTRDWLLSWRSLP